MGDPRIEAGERARESVLRDLRAGGTAIEALARLCETCVELLPVDGVSVSAMTGRASRESIYASDEVAARIEAVQFSLGEGPCFEAFDTGRPVLVPDLRAVTTGMWPVFATQMAGEPVGAVFGFPLTSGAISIGAVDMYRRETGWLSAVEVALALRLTDTAALVLLGLRFGDAGADGLWADLPLGRAQVHQATGMLIAEFAIPADHALARLRGWAFATGRLVDEVADDLVSGRLHPEDLGPP